MWALITLAVVFLVGLALRLSGAPESLFYFPMREAFATPAGYIDATFTSEDGVALHGWLILPRGYTEGARVPAVLHAHGNAGNVASHEDFSNFLPDAGIAVLVFDYRSYGRSGLSPGPMRRDALMRDTEAAYRWLRERPEVDVGRIGVLGVSLGACFAAELAARHPEVRSLCLVAPFARWQRIAGDHLPLVGGLLIGPGLDPQESVMRLGDRALRVVHGADDSIVPPAHGAVVAAAARASGVPADLVEIAGAGHNDLVADEPEGRRAVSEFFRCTLERP